MSDPAEFEELIPADVSSITVLIERARVGCADSRDRVFEQLQSFLESTATRHISHSLRDKEGVSDIVQQSFLRAVEKFETFRGASSLEFRGWLKQLVINEIRQSHRSWNRQVRDVKRELPLTTGTEGNTPGHFLVTSELTPESNALLEEQHELMRKAIATLPPDSQQVIRLRNFEHKSFHEIAALMNRSVVAVTKLWYRAVLKLQQLLSPSDDSI